MWRLHSPDLDTTRALGAALARATLDTVPEEQPVVLGLVGDLGAGKTAFAQGVGQGLALETDVVSPTFVLVAEHEGQRPLLHADLYRLDAGDLPGIGLEEALDSWPGIALVEWADRFPDVLPLDHLSLCLRHAGAAPDAGRSVEIQASGPRSTALLAAWRQAFSSHPDLPDAPDA